jgi:hypothetical protein
MKEIYKEENLESRGKEQKKKQRGEKQKTTTKTEARLNRNGERAREDPKKRGVTNLKPERRTTKEKQTK